MANISGLPSARGSAQYFFCNLLKRGLPKRIAISRCRYSCNSSRKRSGGSWVYGWMPSFGGGEANDCFNKDLLAIAREDEIKARLVLDVMAKLLEHRKQEQFEG